VGVGTGQDGTGNLPAVIDPWTAQPVASCYTDYAILTAGWNGKKKKKIKLHSLGSSVDIVSSELDMQGFGIRFPVEAGSFLLQSVRTGSRVGNSFYRYKVARA
jgi:hypothetical protein